MKIKLPLDLFQQKKNPEDIYLGLFLKEKAGAVLFIERKRDKLEILAKEQFSYTNGWDNIVEDVDDTLYKLETQTKKSPEKTIFFIYSHFVDDTTHDIRSPFLHKIKELSKNLELKPLGYIECHEGIAGYLEKRDGVVPTCTLIELDGSFLTAFVYKGGKVLYKETIQRSQEIIDDLIPILEKVNHIAMIPTRVVIYDSKNLGVEAEKILSYRWSSELFMQLPKVEVVTDQDLLESLISVFSTQVLPSATEIPRSTSSKETFGFVIGGDVGPRADREQELIDESTPVIAEQKANVFAGVMGPITEFLRKFNTWAKSYFSRLKTVPIPILALVGVCLIGLALFLMEFYFHKADVTIFFPGKQIEKTFPLVASTSSGPASLKLTSGSTTTQFSDSKSTSGKKDIGEKAKGAVTIYNSSLTDGKNFSKGTTITSPNGIAFVLGSDVKVASASGDAAAITPSTSKGDIAAKDIGQEGNLSAGTKFTIEGESAVVIAKNDSAFTGGVKRTVQTVSKQDIEDLKKQAIDKAKEYNDKEVEKNLQNGTKILKDLSEVDLNDPQFSKNAGEEADTISLKSNTKITYYSFKQDELLKFIMSQLKDQIAQGYELPKDTIRYSVKKITKKKDGFELTLEVKAKEVKSLAKDEAENMLVGKKEVDLEKLFKEKYGASGLEFQVHSPLPLFKDRLPFFKRNIVFKVSYL